MIHLPERALLTLAALVLTAAAVQAGDVYLGITMSPITPSMAKALQLEEDEGVLVDEVVADSPAAEAGLRAGDVIVAIDGRRIEGSKSLGKAIRRYEPEDEVTITVVRAGERRDIRATLGEKKSHGFTVWSNDEGDTKVWSWSPGPEGDGVFQFRGPDGEKKFILEGFGVGGRGFLGIVPGEVGEREMEKLDLADERGVLIADLVDDGPAEKAGLHEGDVIVALDDESIDDGDDLHDFLSDTEAGQTVTVRVVRNGDEREFEVELATSPGAIKLSDIYPSGPTSPPRFYSGTIAPQPDREELERERREVEQMKQELQELKSELQALREELEKKK